MSSNQHRARSFLRKHRSGGAGGFSLLEMLVALTLTAIVMTGVLELLQMNTKLARKQNLIADMQQNMRIGMYDILRYARMAGRGGLPAFLAPDATASPVFAGTLLPDGVAMAVQNNVSAGTTVGGNPVLAGTDVLTVRGVIFGPVFQVQSNTEDFSNRRLQLDMLALGVPQDLKAIADATLTPANSETLVLISSRGSTLYGLAEIGKGGAIQTATDADGNARTVGVTIPFTTTGTRLADYKNLMPSGAFPPEMTAVAYMGILEEYRYYVRASPLDPADPTGEIVPRLSRARFYPGTDVVHPTNPTAREDIADNVLDLQIALGVDQNGNGQIDDADADEKDEWLFNSPKDVPDDPGSPGTWRWNGAGNPTRSLRVSLLVRSERPEIQYLSEAITAIEDHDYNEPDSPSDLEEIAQRRYRRRLMQATVDFRNF